VWCGTLLAIADSKPIPAWVRILNLGINMNIELDEVVVQDVSDDALELAAGAARGGETKGGSTWLCWCFAS
jgi:hypothetical protein